MKGPFHPKSWPDFTYQGTTYTLSHLDAYQINVVDSSGVQRAVAITFSDHCFTREYVSGDDPALVYPQSTRVAGCFCADRYSCSLQLKGLIAAATSDNVWTVEDENFALAPTINHLGYRIMYGIIFSMDKMDKNLPTDILMRVRTAFPVSIQGLMTYGKSRFKHLVFLTMSKKRPGRVLPGKRLPLP